MGKVSLPPGLFAIDSALLLAEGIAALAAGRCRFDAAQAAPAFAVAGGEQAHFRLRVMDAAAVAVLHFRHGGLYGRLPFAKDDFHVLGQIGCSSISGLLCRNGPAGPDGIR